MAFGRGARFLRPALVDGAVGAILAPGGKLARAVRFTFAGDRIAGVEIIGDPAVLAGLVLGVLEGVPSLPEDDGEVGEEAQEVPR